MARLKQSARPASEGRPYRVWGGLACLDWANIGQLARCGGRGSVSLAVEIQVPRIAGARRKLPTPGS
jgi:hypothetical protein